MATTAALPVRIGVGTDGVMSVRLNAWTLGAGEATPAVDAQDSTGRILMKRSPTTSPYSRAQPERKPTGSLANSRT
jgi:hypothetical protein